MAKNQFTLTTKKREYKFIDNKPTKNYFFEKLTKRIKQTTKSKMQKVILNDFFKKTEMTIKQTTKSKKQNAKGNFTFCY